MLSDEPQTIVASHITTRLIDYIHNIWVSNFINKTALNFIIDRYSFFAIPLLIQYHTFIKKHSDNDILKYTIRSFITETPFNLIISSYGFIKPPRLPQDFTLTIKRPRNLPLNREVIILIQTQHNFVINSNCLVNPTLFI